MPGVRTSVGSFASAAAAQAYFTNDVVDLGALTPATFGNTLNLHVSLDVTSTSAGSGFYGNLLVGDPPAAAGPAPTPSSATSAATSNVMVNRFVDALAAFSGGDGAVVTGVFEPHAHTMGHMVMAPRGAAFA